MQGFFSVECAAEGHVDIPLGLIGKMQLLLDRWEQHNGMDAKVPATTSKDALPVELSQTTHFSFPSSLALGATTARGW